METRAHFKVTPHRTTQSSTHCCVVIVLPIISIRPSVTPDDSSFIINTRDRLQRQTEPRSKTFDYEVIEWILINKTAWVNPTTLIRRYTPFPLPSLDWLLKKQNKGLLINSGKFKIHLYQFQPSVTKWGLNITPRSRVTMPSVVDFSYEYPGTNAIEKTA